MAQSAKQEEGALDRAIRQALEQLGEEGVPGPEGWTTEAQAKLLKAVALHAYMAGHEDAKIQRALIFQDRSASA